MPEGYQAVALTRTQADALGGATVLEFGTDWCGYCRRARPIIDEVLGQQPEVRHIKVEDGSGKPLGRTYRVKSWPTLIFLRDGTEVARLVRPEHPAPIRQAVTETTRG